MKQVVLFVVALLLWSCSETPTVPIGGHGSLRGTTGVLTPVGVDDAALKEILTSFRVKDRDGMIQLLVTGRAFSVPNGTKVLVVEHGSMYVRKIRVLEGAQKGRAGYVPDEWIKPL
jgi:hypothetical protein